MTFKFSGILSALALGALAAAPAFADTTHSDVITAQGPDQFLARDNLIGVKVKDSNDAIVGDIEDLILDSTNRIVGVIVGTGGVLGLGEKRVGVRLNALDFEEADGTTHAALSTITKADLEAAPAFERSKPSKSLLQRAKEKAQELTDKTTDTSKKAYEAAKPTLDAAKEKVKETYESAKEAAKDSMAPAPSE